MKDSAIGEPIRDGRTRLRDGRALAYAEWGDVHGPPVFFFHGSPLSRLWCPDEEATEAAGVHLVTIDRPDFGGSDLQPGRRLEDWPLDVAELADPLASSASRSPALGRRSLRTSVRGPPRRTGDARGPRRHGHAPRPQGAARRDRRARRRGPTCLSPSASFSGMKSSTPSSRARAPSSSRPGSPDARSRSGRTRVTSRSHVTGSRFSRPSPPRRPG
jgi:hypothetical protein